MDFLRSLATAQADHADASFPLRVSDTAGNEALSTSHLTRTQYAGPAQLAR